MGTDKNIYRIIGGPDRHHLFLAIEHLYDEDINVKLELCVLMPEGEPGANYVLLGIEDIKASSIEHGCESGFVFTIRGSCQVTFPFKLEKEERKFVAWYNTKFREGYMSFEAN